MSFLHLFLTAAFAVTPAADVPFSLNVKGGATTFTAIGKPAMIRIKGEGPAPQGHLEISGADLAGELTLPLNDLKTGIDLRDEHMKEKYLQTKEFPQARLKLEKISVGPFAQGATLNKKALPFHGTLSLHGRTHSVEGIFDLSGESAAPHAVAHFTVPLSDYGIDIPTYAGVKVSDHVEVSVDLNTARK